MPTSKYSTTAQVWTVHFNSYDTGPYGWGPYGEYLVTSTLIGLITLTAGGRYAATMVDQVAPIGTYKTKDGARDAIVRRYEKGLNT